MTRDDSCALTVAHQDEAEGRNRARGEPVDHRGPWWPPIGNSKRWPRSHIRILDFVRASHRIWPHRQQVNRPPIGKLGKFGQVPSCRP